MTDEQFSKGKQAIMDIHLSEFRKQASAKKHSVCVCLVDILGLPYRVIYRENLNRLIVDYREKIMASKTFSEIINEVSVAVDNKYEINGSRYNEDALNLLRADIGKMNKEQWQQCYGKYLIGYENDIPRYNSVDLFGNIYSDAIVKKAIKGYMEEIKQCKGVGCIED